MKIGIIVHSHTGHTYSIAQELMDKLTSAGHSVTIEKVIALDDKQVQPDKIQLESRPDIDVYDGIVFGAPVRGMSLSPIMSTYLDGINALNGKKIACIITQSFPFPWMGGNRSMDQMLKLCESKGGNIIGTGIINWSKKNRDNNILELVNRLSSSFGL